MVNGFTATETPTIGRQAPGNERENHTRLETESDDCIGQNVGMYLIFLDQVCFFSSLVIPFKLIAKYKMIEHS